MTNLQNNSLPPQEIANNSFGKVHQTIKVSIEILSYGLRENFMAPLKLYLLLKFSCSGKLIITDQVMQEIAEQLHYKSTKSVQNNLEKLYADDWIGFNPKSGYTFIRSFERMRIKKEFYRLTSAELSFNDLQYLHEFAVAAIITSLINGQKRKIKIRAVHNQDKSGTIPPGSFFPISTHVLANVLNCSIMQAWRLRKEAVKLGYLKMRKPKPVPIGVHITDYQHLMKSTENVKNFRLKKNQVLIQDCFLLKSNLFLRSRCFINNQVRLNT
ncbi:hypothetical protein ES705_14810 [subsurface metagenome]